MLLDSDRGRKSGCADRQSFDSDEVAVCIEAAVTSWDAHGYTDAIAFRACAICRDDESLYEFLTDKVGALPSVERVETVPIIRTVKLASLVPVVRS